MGPAPFGAIEPFGFPDPGRLMANMDRQLDQARPQGVPRDIPVDVKEVRGACADGAVGACGAWQQS